MFFALVLAVMYPAALPLAALIVLPIDPSVSVGPTTITWSKIFLLTGVLRVAFDLLRDAKYRAQISEGVKLPAWFLVAFVAWSALSIIWAHHHGAALRETLKWAEYLLAFIVGFYLLARNRVVMIVVLVAWTVLLAIASATQFLGSVHGAGTAATISARASGMFTGPNQASGYFEAIAALGFAMLFTLRRPWRLVQAFTLAFPMLGVGASGSRGGIAGLAAMGVAGVLATLRTKRILPLVLGTAAIIIALTVFATLQPARLSAGLKVSTDIGNAADRVVGRRAQDGTLASRNRCRSGKLSARLC